MTLAIGLGCRREWPADAIVALVEQTCAGLDRTGARLFTHQAKADEGSLHVASALLGLPLLYLSTDELRLALPGVTVRSSRVEGRLGVASVAEAAALAGAGACSRLLVPRQTDGGATCAVAVAVVAT